MAGQEKKQRALAFVRIFLMRQNPAANAGKAISLVHPDVVDVSSGVEYTDRKGKDPEKIAAFIQAVKES